MINRIEIETTHTHFLVLGLGYWGKGKTLKEGKKNCMKEGCKAKDKMLAFWGTEDIGCEGGYVSATHLLYLGEL